MSSTAEGRGAGESRPPVTFEGEVPPGSIFLLTGAWLLAAAGSVTLMFTPILVFSTPEDIAAGRIWAFALCGAVMIAGAAMLFTHFVWAWGVALLATLASALWIGATGGLRQQYEPAIAAAVAVTVVILLLLGRKTAGKPEAMALSSARLPFSVKLGIVWLSIFFLLAVLFALMQFDVAWMMDNFRFVAWGLLYTILLAIMAIVLAVILALLGALGRLSSNPVSYGLSGFYVSFFRGTPLIVQLFLIYLALPQIGQTFDRSSVLNILALTSFQAGVLGLGLNYGAYMTEIFRAGIQSVSHGQAEAADALGLTYAQRMRRVVLPQALRVIIPPTGNEFIAMMKDTALVSVLGSELETAELFRRAKVVGPPDHKSLEALILAASLYWALTAVFTFFQKRLENRLSRGYVRMDARAATGQKRFQFLPGGGGSSGGAGGGGGGGVVMTGEGPDTNTEGML